MKIKQPMVIDTSGWNYGSDFTKIPGLAGIYTKASEGYFTRSSWFIQTWAQAKQLGIPRAAYHFYRERWYGLPRDPKPQADLFADMIEKAGGLIQGDLIIIDAEDDYMTIGKILALGRLMRQRFNKWPLIYTGFYKIKDNMHGFEDLTEADIDDLKKMSLIISFYPDNPDLFNSLPSQYVPNQDYFGRVVGWQYAGDVDPETLGFTSVKSSIDLNLFDPIFFDMWKRAYTTQEPVPPPVELPPDPDEENNDILFKDFIVKNNLDVPTSYHVISVDSSKVDIVTDTGMNFMTLDQWMNKTGVDIAINGPTGWYLSQLKKRPMTVLDGVSYYHGRGSGQWGITQTLFIDQMNRFSLVRPSVIWNAVGFPNILVKNSVIQPIRKSTIDIRARTAIGINKDQTRLYLVTVDGGDYWEHTGMNFQQVALIMRDLGCDLAIMGDGGGSTTAMRRDFLGQMVVIGKPSGEEFRVIGGTTYKMRPTANHFGLRRKS